MNYGGVRLGIATYDNLHTSDGDAMKTETKGKYMERLNTCTRTLMQGIEEANALPAEERSPERQGKMLALFNEIRDVQNKLLDGLYISSAEASNEICRVELKVRRMFPLPGDSASDAAELLDAQDGATLTVVPNWNNPVEVSEDAPDIVRQVAEAQRIMLSTYDQIVTKHPIAAHVPVVTELQTAARSLNTIMQGLAKVGALL